MPLSGTFSTTKPANGPEINQFFIPNPHLIAVLKEEVGKNLKYYRQSII